MKSNKFTILIFITLGMWKCEYNIFNLPHEYEINDHVKIWVCMVSKFGGYRPYRRGDILFFIWHVTSSDHMLGGSCDIMGEFPSLQITILPSLVVAGVVKDEIFYF